MITLITNTANLPVFSPVVEFSSINQGKYPPNKKQSLKQPYLRFSAICYESPLDLSHSVSRYTAYH